MSEQKIWEEHPFVFHYTNIAGVKGILESKSLHATHYRDLNDTAEVAHFRGLLVQMLIPHVREFFVDYQKRNVLRMAEIVRRFGSLDGLVEHEAGVIANTLYRVTFERSSGNFRFADPYIVSFCGHHGDYERANGLLSQWRGYGGDSGFALEFDTHKLWTAVGADVDRYHHIGAIYMGSVVYDGTPDVEREFNQFIDLAKAALPAMFQGQNADPTALNPLFAPFVQAATRFKHGSFEEEQEVRITISPLDQTGFDYLSEHEPSFNRALGVRKKCTRSNLSGYIELKIDAPELPVVGIIVGPHREQALRRDRLERFLERLGLSIPVKTSSTPLV